MLGFALGFWQRLSPFGAANQQTVLIQAGSALHPEIAFARASAAAFLSSADGELLEVGNNAPRFDPALGLVVEEQRSNGIRNPRAEGASPGTPGISPTNWFINRAAGLSTEIVAVGSTLGVPWVDIRVFGTTTDASLWLNASFETNAAVPAVVNGQSVSYALHLALVDGSLPSGGFNIRQQNYDGSRVTMGYQGVASITPTSTLTRYTGTIVTSQVGVAFCALNLWSDGNGTGQTMDFTVRLGLPQQEVNRASVTQPILPAQGTPTASTRLMDVVTAPLSALGIPDTGACTVVGNFIPRDVTGFPTLIEVNAGSTQDRFWVWYGGANSIRLSRNTANVNQQVTAATGLVANAPARVALSHDGLGRVALSVNGGAVAVVTGAPTSGYTQLRAGSSFNAGAPFSGYIPRLAYLPGATPDAELPALSAN